MRATLAGMYTSFRSPYTTLPDVRPAIFAICTALHGRCTALPDTYTALLDVHMALRGVYTLLSDAYMALCTQALRTAATGRPEGLHYISMCKTKPLLPI